VRPGCSRPWRATRSFRGPPLPGQGGSGDDDAPRVGTAVTLGVALVAIWFGDLNMVAPVLTMFFLTSYMTVNFAAGVEGFLRAPRSARRSGPLGHPDGGRPRLPPRHVPDQRGGDDRGRRGRDRRLHLAAAARAHRHLGRRAQRDLAGPRADGAPPARASGRRPELAAAPPRPVRGPTERWPLIDFANAITHNRGLVTDRERDSRRSAREQRARPRWRRASRSISPTGESRRSCGSSRRPIPSPGEAARRGLRLRPARPEHRHPGRERAVERRDRYCEMIETFHRQNGT
jgi:hypothetical protein